MNIWLISDTHFFQDSILTFIDYKNGELLRPGFDNIQQHDDYIVEQWNSMIKPEDTVYHLGDVCDIAQQHRYPELHNLLNGTKHLIVGNHDDIVFQSTVAWASVNFWKDLHEYNILLTHTPQHKFSLLRGHPGKSFGQQKPKYRLNVHGHVHQNPAPTRRHRCVCLEHTNYKPVNIDKYIKDEYHV